MSAAGPPHWGESSLCRQRGLVGREGLDNRVSPSCVDSGATSLGESSLCQQRGHLTGRVQLVSTAGTCGTGGARQLYVLPH